MFMTFDPQDAALSELKISSGETLVITEGRLPSKVLQCFECSCGLMICYSFVQLPGFSFPLGFPQNVYMAVLGSKKHGKRF